MVAHLRSTTALCCCHRCLFLCLFMLVPATCLFALVLLLVCTCSVLHVLLPSAHVLTCVHLYWSPLLACPGPFMLVLLLVCTHLVLCICLPSVHVLTHVCSCWSLQPACSGLFWLVLPLVCTHLVLCMCSPAFFRPLCLHVCMSACLYPFVHLYSLGCAGSHLFVCFFVLVRAHLSASNTQLVYTSCLGN